MGDLVAFAIARQALKFLGTIPKKLRAQIIKKAKALQLNPYPQGCKKLEGVTAPTGEAVYRERAGDYRILYVVRKQSTATEVVVIDIDDRKDVYR